MANNIVLNLDGYKPITIALVSPKDPDKASKGNLTAQLRATADCPFAGSFNLFMGRVSASATQLTALQTQVAQLQAALEAAQKTAIKTGK